MPYRHVKDGHVYFTSQPDGSEEHVPSDNQEYINSCTPPEPTNEEIYDQTMQNNLLIKAIAISLNAAGAFSSTGKIMTNSELKNIIKDNM